MAALFRRAALVVLASFLTFSALGSTASAVSDAASSNAMDQPSAFGPPMPGVYRRPVERVVSDPFRMENGPYGAGNFGLEYETSPGDPVGAIGSGVVTFAGSVAGRIAVTVQHPDGRRSSLTGLSSLVVQEQQIVVRGQLVGRALRGLQLGMREGARYVDPALFLMAIERRARLVPK
jgi:murein DD-endopeptidase MepM/ murein hydrolase activator NlpD